MIKLPSEKKEITMSNPKMTIIYSLPKCGKSTLAAELNNNLILDLEEGTEYLEALSVKIIGWEPPKETAEAKKKRYESEKYYITEVGKQIVDEGYPYDYITIDTCSKLEDFILPLAARMYKSTPMGAKWEGTDVRELPKGSGYLYMRNAWDFALSKLRKLAKHIILLGHVKDALINKEGKEVSAKDLDLTGKIKITTCAAADAVGYLYRGANNELRLNFKSNEELTCGSRCPQLKGQDIIMADYNEKENKLENVRWDLIFPDTHTKGS